MEFLVNDTSFLFSRSSSVQTSHLNEHVANVHSDSAENICHICGLILGSRAAVKRHVRIHDNPDQILTEEEEEDEDLPEDVVQEEEEKNDDDREEGDDGIREGQADQEQP